MTEKEWNECSDSKTMLDFLAGRMSEREGYLICSAFVRRVWHLLDDQRSVKAMELVERLPEEEVDENEFVDAKIDAAMARNEYQKEAEDNSDMAAQYHACGAVYEAMRRWPEGTADKAVEVAVALAIENLEVDLEEPEEELDEQFETATVSAETSERALQASLLRDILGGLFTPKSIEAAWRTRVVVQLAHAAYEERLLPSGHLEPDRLAVLSDALEEAGCENATILDHLRSPGPHVRGCWAVDLLLARE